MRAGTPVRASGDRGNTRSRSGGHSGRRVREARRPAAVPRVGGRGQRDGGANGLSSAEGP